MCCRWQTPGTQRHLACLQASAADSQQQTHQLYRSTQPSTLSGMEKQWQFNQSIKSINIHYTALYKIDRQHYTQIFQITFQHFKLFDNVKHFHPFSQKLLRIHQMIKNIKSIKSQQSTSSFSYITLRDENGDGCVLPS